MKKTANKFIAVILALLIALMIIPSAVSFAEEPSGEPTEEVPSEAPTEEPTPEPTEEPTPEPTEEPTPVPTEEPTPEPTEEPTPVPTEEPTPVPTEEPTPVPTEEPTPAYRVTGGGTVYLYKTTVSIIPPRFVTVNGENMTLSVRKNESVMLQSPDTGKWQIQIYGKWADIAGETSDMLYVSRALFEDFLSEQDKVYSVYVRQIPDNKNSPVRMIELKLKTGETDESPFSVSTKLDGAAASYGGHIGDDGIKDGIETKILFKYIDPDGETAADPVSVLRSADYTDTIDINIPKIKGFVPTVNGSQVDRVEITNKSASDVTVVYKPESGPKIVFFLQNAEDDGYTRSDEKKQFTGSVTAPYGYRVIYADMSNPVMEADGQKIYVLCDRNYSMLNLIQDGIGQQVEYLYFRNGRVSELPAVIKDGYRFTGWKDAGGRPVMNTRDLQGATEVYTELVGTGGNDGEKESEEAGTGKITITANADAPQCEIVARLTGANLNNVISIAVKPGVKTVIADLPAGEYHLSFSAEEPYFVSGGAEQDAAVEADGDTEISLSVAEPKTTGGTSYSSVKVIFNAA